MLHTVSLSLSAFKCNTYQHNQIITVKLLSDREIVQSNVVKIYAFFLFRNGEVVYIV